MVTAPFRPTRDQLAALARSPACRSRWLARPFAWNVPGGAQYTMPAEHRLLGEDRPVVMQVGRSLGPALAESCVGIPINRTVRPDAARAHRVREPGQWEMGICPESFVGFIEAAIVDDAGLLATLAILDAEADADLAALDRDGALAFAGLCLVTTFDARIVRGAWGITVADVTAIRGAALDFASWPIVPGCRVLRRLEAGEPLRETAVNGTRQQAGDNRKTSPRGDVLPAPTLAESSTHASGLAAASLASLIIQGRQQGRPVGDEGEAQLTSAVSGLISGAILGSFVGPVGTFVGAFAGAVIGLTATEKGPDAELAQNRVRHRAREAQIVFDQMMTAITTAGDIDTALRTSIHRFPPERPDTFIQTLDEIRPGVRRPILPPRRLGPSPFGDSGDGSSPGEGGAPGGAGPGGDAGGGSPGDPF